MTFLNAAILVGFVTVLIPPLIHLFRRRTEVEIDWAAMQFLAVSPRVKRRLVWEHLLLLLVRMGIVAGLVAALASPAVVSSWLAQQTSADPRDVVLILDGSASMAYKPPQPAADAARRWATDFLGTLGVGDRVAVIQARQRPTVLLNALTEDHEQAANALELLAAPGGSADWLAAFQAAVALLEGDRPNRHIVAITDGQRYGWADEETLARWEMFHRAHEVTPRVWVASLAGPRPARVPNWSLDPIRTGRAVAVTGREITFHAAVRRTGGDEGAKPGKVHLRIDGRPAGTVTPDTAARGVFPVRFVQKFAAGSHAVALQLDPDDLPADDRQDYAIEVLAAVPVLIVDGHANGSSAVRGSDFLRTALAPANDPTPAFVVRVVPVSEFRATTLSQNVASTGTLPRVLILANLTRVTTEQQMAIERFLAGGGSVLVTLGDRVDPVAWNRVAFRGGQGFLPARVVATVGDPAEESNASRPDPASFTHPAIEVFADPLPGGLAAAVLPMWWKLDVATGGNSPTGTTVARLTTGDPLLVERGFGTGRVLMACVPLDTSWGTNLPRLPDFVRLAHELAYYLAGVRGASLNIDPAQPMVFTPRPEEPPGPVAVFGPDGRTKSVSVSAWPMVLEGPHDPGAYRLTTPAGRTNSIAVRPDPREAELTPASTDDLQKVAATVSRLTYVTTPAEVGTDAGDGPALREVWWLLMVGVLGLLGLELWYTRRLVGHETPTSADSARARSGHG